MGRKAYEVTGYAPPDEGIALCVDCHAERFPDHSEDDCECGAIFLSEETDSVQTCDQCGEEIETSVIGED